MCPLSTLCAPSCCPPSPQRHRFCSDERPAHAQLMHTHIHTHHPSSSSRLSFEIVKVNKKYFDISLARKYSESSSRVVVGRWHDSLPFESYRSMSSKLICRTHPPFSLCFWLCIIIIIIIIIIMRNRNNGTLPWTWGVGRVHWWTLTFQSVYFLTAYWRAVVRSSWFKTRSSLLSSHSHSIWEGARAKTKPKSRIWPPALFLMAL